MRRHALKVTTQTLWDQLQALGQRLKPINLALLEYTLAQPVIGLDQTSWPRLDGKGEKPWQMWCLTSPKTVCHRICDDKAARTFKELVGSFEGVIVCDALKTHEAGAREGRGIVLGACWAHVCRKFEEAVADHPEAQLALDWIGKLYEIDERAAGEPGRKLELRRAESTAALFYSLLETWKLHAIDPAKYVREAVRAVDRGEILLPWQMGARETQPDVKSG